ncbi:MAG: hypothetical protein LW823_08360 [Rickettsiales bacterium]|jgi:OOP family OmpA-OmpF porin|nr:hypothetical protein [Rickettsiales bacterium]
MRAKLALMSLVWLAGCEGQLSSLKQADLTRDDFATALAREYRDYADSEAEQGRTGEAERFAAKGLAVLSGQSAAPDEPESASKKLSQARGELIALLTEENKDYDPAALARAQVLFDCWISEDNRGHQNESDACAAEFRAVVDRLKEDLQ